MKTKIFAALALLSINASAEPFQRLHDESLNLPAEWQSCTHDNQCVAIGYGCSSTAVNREFRAQAEKQAWAIGGDPRAVSCVRDEDMDHVTKCENNRCGDFVRKPDHKMPME